MIDIFYPSNTWKVKWVSNQNSQCLHLNFILIIFIWPIFSFWYFVSNWFCLRPWVVIKLVVTTILMSRTETKKCRNHATYSEWPLIWGSMQFCIYYKKICKLIYCKDFTQTGFSYSGIPLLIENVIFSTYYIFIKYVYQNILVCDLI